MPAIVLVLLLAACATPAEHFAREAAAFGFAPTVLYGEGFRHVAYFAEAESPGASLHVYIEHDGSPWIDASRIAADPTPRVPFSLELMARDSGSRLLLGRPCYYETATDAGCGPVMWTHRRYAPEVVASMVAALRTFLRTHGFSSVILIGYSGGGTLAWLMASRLSQARAVVTVAANLDTDYWTALHGYTAMSGSLNPARELPLRDSVRQVHFVGGRDDNVPPSVARSFSVGHPKGRIIELPDYDHRCCWISSWPRLFDDAFDRQPGVSAAPLN